MKEGGLEEVPNMNIIEIEYSDNEIVKIFKDNYSLEVENAPTTILGCWVINHKFKGYKTNENERIIVGAFEVVFDQETISLYDDFVRLGGDSIKAIRVISLLQKEGISCNAKDILTYKTPYLIARNIGEEVEVSYDAVVEGRVGLLPIQSYFFEEVNKNDYMQGFTVKSLVDLDIGTLQKAWDELSNIHDMLRVSYSIEDGVPVQEIMPLGTRTCQINEIVIDGDLGKNLVEINEKANNSLDIYNNKII